MGLGTIPDAGNIKIVFPLVNHSLPSNSQVRPKQGRQFSMELTRRISPPLLGTFLVIIILGRGAMATTE